jgi:hypothetical protein
MRISTKGVAAISVLILPVWACMTSGADAGITHDGMSLATQAALTDWTAGINEVWIAQYLLDQGLVCPNCPTNMQPRSLSAINCRLLDMAANRHVGVYREIVPLQMLQTQAPFSNPGNDPYRAKILDVVRLYYNYNLYLILTFGRPFPQWMSPQYGGDGAWCVLPEPSDQTTWATLKNNMSWAVGDFVNWLQLQGISSTWMSTHLVVEGMNEFDDLTTIPCDTVVDSRGATPQRAADYQGGINWVLNYYGIQTLQSSPSVVGNFAGYTGDAKQRIRRYLQDYYAAGGGGYPQMHFYASSVSAIRGAVTFVNFGLSLAWQNKVILGEVGWPEYVSGSCPTGLPTAQRDTFYRDIYQDATIHNALFMLAFWRTMNLTPSVPQHECERFFGVVHDDNSRYKVVGQNLFTSLGGQGGSGPNCGASTLSL